LGRAHVIVRCFGGEAPVVIDTNNVEHFYDRGDHSTYHVVREEGGYKVVKVEEAVADEGGDGGDKMPLFPVFPYKRRQTKKGRWEIVDDESARIVYDISQDSVEQEEEEADQIGNKDKPIKGRNKVAEVLTQPRSAYFYRH
jgi:hypothetical protein